MCIRDSVYTGRDLETKKRTYLNQTIHGALRDAQTHLNKMLGKRDRGRKLDSSKQTLNQYLDRWLELASISAFDIQTLYRDLLVRSLSARSIRYTHAVLRSALKQAMRWNLILSNPADSVDLPRQDRREIGVLNVEKARTFVREMCIRDSSNGS